MINSYFHSFSYEIDFTKFKHSIYLHLPDLALYFLYVTGIVS